MKIGCNKKHKWSGEQKEQSLTIPKKSDVYIVGLESSIWSPPEKSNDWFEQVVLPIIPTKGNN